MDTRDNYSDCGRVSSFQAKLVPPKAKIPRHGKDPKKPGLNLKKMTANIVKKKDQISQINLLHKMQKALKRKKIVASKKTMIPQPKLEKTKMYPLQNSEPKEETKRQAIARVIVPKNEVPSKSVSSLMCQAPPPLTDFRTKLIHKPSPADSASMPKQKFECVAPKEFPWPRKAQKNIKVEPRPNPHPEGQKESMIKMVFPSKDTSSPRKLQKNIQKDPTRNTARPVQKKFLPNPEIPIVKPKPQNGSVNKDYFHNDQFPRNSKPPRTSSDIDSVKPNGKGKTTKPRKNNRFLNERNKVLKHKPRLNLGKKPPIRSKTKKTKNGKSIEALKKSPDRFWLLRWF